MADPVPPSSGPLARLAEHPRRTLAAGAAIFAVALAVSAVAAAHDPRHLWTMIDLQVYRWGGLMARQHANVYDLKFQGFLSFTYTPLAVVFFEALSFFSISVLRFVMTGLSLGALLGAVWLAWGMVGVSRSAARWGLALGVAGIALGLEPVNATLAFGQINLLLLVLVMADLALADTVAWKGVGVGLAAAIKLTPLVFVAYLLLTRRLRAAGVALGTFAASLAVGFVLLPSGSHRFWLGGLFLDSKRVGGVPYAGNQSINGTLVRLFASVDGARGAWLVVAGVAGVAGLLLAALASRRGQELLGVATCGLTALLVSPISWSHHWVWVVLAVPCAAGVLAPLRPRARRLGWAVVALVLVVFHAGPLRLIWAPPHNGNLEYGWHGVQLALGNAYVLAGGLLLAALGAYLLRSRDGLRLPVPRDR